MESGAGGKEVAYVTGVASYQRVPGFQALDGEVVSQAKANFDAWVKTQTFTAANELHAAGVAACVAGKPLEAIEQHRDELADQLNVLGVQLRDATVEMQLLDDAEPNRPASTIDFDVVNLGRKLGRLHADYVAVNKLYQGRVKAMSEPERSGRIEEPKQYRPIQTPPKKVDPTNLPLPQRPKPVRGAPMRPSWKIDDPDKIEVYEISLRRYGAKELGPVIAKLETEWENLQVEAVIITDPRVRERLQKRLNWCHIRLELAKQRRDDLTQIQHQRRGPRL